MSPMARLKLKIICAVCALPVPLGLWFLHAHPGIYGLPVLLGAGTTILSFALVFVFTKVLKDWIGK